jgi:predicted TPR repeat methyltransferase
LAVARDALEKYLAVPARPGAPAHADATYRLGQVLERLGDRTGAVARYRRALELNPQHQGARQALALLEGTRPPA